MLRIQTIALALTLCGGVAVAAGAQEASATPKSDTTTLSSSGKRHQHQMRASYTDRADRALYRGIELSSAQRAQVDSIRKKYQAESKPLREQMEPAMKEARAARQSGDSAKVQAARQKVSASRDKMIELRKQEMAKERGVLTPEQQATFDKNVSSAKKRVHEGRQGRGGRSGGSPTS